MAIVAWLIWGLGLTVVVSGIVEYFRQASSIVIPTRNMLKTILFLASVSLVLTGFGYLSKFHLLWLFPVSLGIGFLVMLISLQLRLDLAASQTRRELARQDPDGGSTDEEILGNKISGCCKRMLLDLIELANRHGLYSDNNALTHPAGTFFLLKILSTFDVFELAEAEATFEQCLCKALDCDMEKMKAECATKKQLLREDFGGIDGHPEVYLEGLFKSAIETQTDRIQAIFRRHHDSILRIVNNQTKEAENLIVEYEMRKTGKFAMEQ